MRCEFEEYIEIFRVNFGKVVITDKTVPEPDPEEPEYEVYEGNYEVIPQVGAQVLDTSDKYLKEDITIQGVPFSAVSNPAGGETVYIASELA